MVVSDVERGRSWPFHCVRSEQGSGRRAQWSKWHAGESDVPDSSNDVWLRTGEGLGCDE